MKAEELVAGESRGREPWVATRRWAWLSCFFEEVNKSKPNASLTLVIYPENISSSALWEFQTRCGSAYDAKIFTPLLQRRRDEFDDLRKSVESDTSEDDQKQDRDGHEGQGPVHLYVRAERINVRRRYKGFHNNFLGELFSEDANIKVHIRQSEELAFIDFLIFLYKPECSKDYEEYRLLDILKMASRFRAFEACARSLMNHHPENDPVTKYLELGKKLPPSLNQRMEPLAKNYILNRFKDISSTYDELIKQPFSVIKLVLNSHDVRVSSEDVIFDLVVDWAKHNYPDDLSARQWMLDMELFSLIRFFHVSGWKLLEAADSQDVDRDFIRRAVYSACLFKTRVQYDRCTETGLEKRRERIYDVPVDVKVYGPPSEFCSVTMRVTPAEYDRIALHAREKIRTQPIRFVKRTMAVEISSRKVDVVSSSRPNKRIPYQKDFEVALRAMEGGDFPFRLRYEIGLWLGNFNLGYAVLFRGYCRFGCAGTRHVATFHSKHLDFRVDLYRLPWDVEEGNYSFE